MRLCFGLLLTVALSMELVRAFRCHQCKGFGGCQNQTKCQTNSDHCITFATHSPLSLSDMPLVTKKCSIGCPDPSQLGLGPNVSIFCCQASLCNTE